jgi:hypothetical protein
MKTFDDLKFEKHHSDRNGTIAKMNFDNGYGISVITGDRFYTTTERPYEVAVLWNDKIDYTSGITKDVIGYQTKREVEGLMEQIQNLKPKEEAA